MNIKEKTRNKERSKGQFIKAAIELLENDGFQALGINAIADKAGLNKVLIYRYFGGLSGLLKAAADSMDLTKTKALDFGAISSNSGEELKKLFSDGFYLMHEQLRNDKLAMQIMAQVMLEENELTLWLSKAREEQGVETTERAKQIFMNKLSGEEIENADFNALFAIISSAVYFLTLRAKTAKIFNGVDIQSENGWRRICDTLALMLEKTLKE